MGRPGVSCSRHMSQVTVGGAITVRTSTKTAVYSGDRKLNAFMDTCHAALRDFSTSLYVAWWLDPAEDFTQLAVRFSCL